MQPFRSKKQETGDRRKKKKFTLFLRVT